MDSVPLPMKMHSFDARYLGAKTEDRFITLTDWVDENYNGNNAILQIDIERFEWDVLANSDKNVLKRFKIICIEFHDLHHLYHRSAGRLMNAILEKILSTHTPVHAHINNCTEVYKSEGRVVAPVMEVTFLRNDNDFSCYGYSTLPHKLDSKAVSDLPDIDISQLYN